LIINLRFDKIHRMGKTPEAGLVQDVTFKFQGDPSFRYLKEAGVGKDLSNSGYCWAACIDMALSPFIPDDLLREMVIGEAVKSQKSPSEVFTANGSLLLSGLEGLLAGINSKVAETSPLVTLDLIKPAGIGDIHPELEQGRAVIFGLIEGNSIGHLMVIDGFHRDGGKYIYSVFNPASSDPVLGREYVDSFNLYGLDMYSDTKVLPLLISVGRPAREKGA
jgi:hypothetical protein